MVAFLIYSVLLQQAVVTLYACHGDNICQLLFLGIFLSDVF